MNWYIESWAVWGGLAFASRRHPESDESQETVFLAAPSFQVTPIGRISTAWAAARGGAFQQGFFSEDGEVAFESLRQIVEVVRRGYRRGGFGPEPGEPGADRPPFAPDTDSGQTAPTDRARWDNVVQGVEMLTSQGHSREALRDAIVGALDGEYARDAVFSYGALALRYLKNGAHNSGANRAQVCRDCHALLHVLFLLNPHAAYEEHRDHHRYWRYLELGLFGNERFNDEILSGRLLSKLPVRNNLSLGQYLAMACSDRISLLAETADVQNFAPALFGAILIASAAKKSSFYFFHEYDFHIDLRSEIFQMAADWLAANLPDDSLHGHVAEAAVHALLGPMGRRVS